MSKRNKILYWITTVWLALGMFSTGLVQLLKVQKDADMMIHLGYPLYLMTLLGVWKLLGVIVILMPKLPVLKEWAYAGFFFAMSGALISHLVLGDDFSAVFPSVLLLVLTAFSWYLRPESRKIVNLRPSITVTSA